MARALAALEELETRLEDRTEAQRLPEAQRPREAHRAVEPLALRSPQTALWVRSAPMMTVRAARQWEWPPTRTLSRDRGASSVDDGSAPAQPVGSCPTRLADCPDTCEAERWPGQDRTARSRATPQRTTMMTASSPAWHGEPYRSQPSAAIHHIVEIDATPSCSPTISPVADTSRRT